MTTVTFQPGVSIDFDAAAPLALAEQIESALAADGSAPVQIITTSESVSTSDPFVLIPAAFADTVVGSGNQDVAGDSGGLTYTNNGSGSTVSVALNGGNNDLTFGSGVSANVATGAGNDTVMASGSGNFNVGAGTNIVNLSGDTNSNDTVTVTAAGSGDQITLGAATTTVNESGSGAVITAGPGNATVNGAAGADLTLVSSSTDLPISAVLGAGVETLNASRAAGGVDVDTDGGNDTITGSSGNDFYFIQGGQTSITAGLGFASFYVTATAAPSHITIDDFSAADTVALFGTSSVASILANGVVENGSLTLTLAAGNTVTFVGVTNVSSYVIDPYQGAIPVCYRAGTRILTDRGEVAIEQLTLTDRVVTASGAHRPVRWLGSRRVDCARHPDPSSVWPVRIQAAAFADGLPSRDLWVSPGHAIFTDGVLIQATNLINGASIAQVPLASVEYWHVELDDHDILLAESLPAESYLDTGNRAGFFNNGGAYLEAHPDFKPKHWAETCVPLVFEGAILQNVKARLLARAQTLGHRITADSDVHIMAAGERIEPLFANAQRVAFVIPPERTAIELRCRGFIPAQIDAVSSDQRRLGVCVGGLQIDGVDVPLDDAARFEHGWHDLEVYSPQHRQRWSQESARLPDGTRLVVLELAARSYCWTQPRAEAPAKLFG